MRDLPVPLGPRARWSAELCTPLGRQAAIATFARVATLHVCVFGGGSREPWDQAYLYVSGGGITRAMGSDLQLAAGSSWQSAMQPTLNGPAWRLPY